MVNSLKSISFLAVIASLTACGGGGGGGSSSEPAPAQPSVNVSLPVSNLVVDEGGATKFRVTATEGADISFTGAQVSSIQKDGNEYVLTAGQVDRPVTENLQVIASLNGATAEAALNVAITDASAQGLVSGASSMIANKDSALELEEDGALFKALVESMYLQSALEGATASNSISAPMSFAEKQATLELFNPAQESSYEPLSQSLDALTQTLENYRKGRSSESQLESALSSTQSKIESHASNGAQKLAPYFSALYPNVNLESDTTLSFSEELGRFTRYIGNSSFGSYQNGAWVFDAQYGLLNSVIPTNDNNIGFCEG